MNLNFKAPEYHTDTHFETVEYRFRGSPGSGWQIEREGRPHLELGPGYRLLRTRACGICSTDLARHLLPFPLPQVTGHEAVVEDLDGRRYVVEINASHASRHVELCAYCRRGLAHHCPDRIVLGIHDLPGGFGPYVLAPIGATLDIPDSLPTSSAVLVEPFAAALHAVDTIAPRVGDRIAVLGPRRLGLLAIAALAAHRDSERIDFEILAISRHAPLLELARSLGADASVHFEGNGDALRAGLADVIIDTTGSTEGLPLAVRLAAREVHLKSTHGQPSAGLAHPTELVVDEISLARLPDSADEGRAALSTLAGAIGSSSARVGWLAKSEPPAWLDQAAVLCRAGTAKELARAFASNAPGELGRADVVVVEDSSQVDAAVRPCADSEAAAVRPVGEIWLHPDVSPGLLPDKDAKDTIGRSPLLTAIRERGLRLSSSRCGDFRRALRLMETSADLRALGGRFVTHHFSASEIGRAFEVARSPDCIKAVIEHEPTR